MMHKLTQKELESLINTYKNAREQLLNVITTSTGAGTKTYYNTVFQNLNKIIAALNAQTNAYISTAIPREYKAALADTYDYFKKNNLTMLDPSSFASIHNDAIYALSREMQHSIKEGLSQAGRQVVRYLDESQDNNLRKMGLQSAAEKAATGSTVLDTQRSMISKLRKGGFMTVQYGSGSRAYSVGLDAYAGMVARSTTREAGNLARENQLTENGYDLVQMTTHYPTCEICATFQGRVYSISGKDNRFPRLSIAFKSGYHNIHPNCRHSVTPWVEEMQDGDEIQEAKENSNKPFEDNRPEAEKGLYNKQQSDNRQLRQDLYQYERYKAKLGEDAPKSFRSFKKIKTSKGEAWENLQKKYREK